MTKIVRYDRRTINRGTPREIIIVKFNASNISKESEDIPKNIIEHWKNNKSIFGYASFNELSKKDCKKIFGFAKTGKIKFGITRMGNIISFKIKE